MKLFTMFVLLIASTVGFAESKAKKDRGFSCTETCTLKKNAAHLNQDISNLGKAADYYNQYCSVAGKGNPGNVNGCQNSCTSKDVSLKTKLFNKSRGSDVDAYIKKLTDRCGGIGKNLHSHGYHADKSGDFVKAAAKAPAAQNNQPAMKPQPPVAHHQEKFSPEECRRLPNFIADLVDFKDMQKMLKKMGEDTSEVDKSIKTLEKSIRELESGCPRTAHNPRKWG